MLCCLIRTLWKAHTLGNCQLKINPILSYNYSDGSTTKARMP